MQPRAPALGVPDSQNPWLDSPWKICFAGESCTAERPIAPYVTSLASGLHACQGQFLLAPTLSWYSCQLPVILCLVS